MEIPNHSTGTELLKCFKGSGVRGATFSQTPMVGWKQTPLGCVFGFPLAAGSGKPSKCDGCGCKTCGGVGCSGTVKDAKCGSCFFIRLCAGDAQKGAVGPGRRKYYFLMPVSHERRRNTSDLAEGDGWGWRQHSNLQYNEWPKDSKGLRRPCELCPQQSASLGHLPSPSHPARWRMLQVHLQHLSLGSCHWQDVPQGLR